MTTRALTVVGDGGAEARRELERCVGDGGVVLFGADTLYGLGCDPADERAIERIHSIKGRDEGKPSAVMFFSPLAMREVLSGAGPRTRAIIGSLLPGPVTLVIENPGRLYGHACGDRPDRLGIRLIEGPLAGVGVPLFQTSANRSGEAPPTRLGQVEPEVLGAVDLLIDCGEASGEPSTVVDISGIEEAGDRWQLLRAGAIAGEELAAAIRSALDGG